MIFTNYFECHLNIRVFEYLIKKNMVFVQWYFLAYCCTLSWGLLFFLSYQSEFTQYLVFILPLFCIVCVYTCLSLYEEKKSQNKTVQDKTKQRKSIFCTVIKSYEHHYLPRPMPLLQVCLFLRKRRQNCRYIKCVNVNISIMNEDIFLRLVVSKWPNMLHLMTFASGRYIIIILTGN